jgi:hypothetical protein
MMESLSTFIIYFTNNMNTGHGIDDVVHHFSVGMNLFNPFT